MNQSKKTKIVATIGPSSEDKQTLKDLAEAGVNIARLNFSHGDYEEHQAKIDRWRAVAEESGQHLGIMQDLSGPEIRTGEFIHDEVELQEGDQFILTTEECDGTEDRVQVSYEQLPQDVSPGQRILLSDGKIELKAARVDGKEITTDVVVGGTLTDRRGVNLPDTDLSVSALTEQDKQDLQFGAENNVDFVALSFVRESRDILKLRDVMNELNLDARVIAKVETQQAVDNIETIIEEADGIMVARGDLAVEIGPEYVPAVQKDIIRRCNDRGMPVITATQMLESMTDNQVPTRAEVSDIANAILDGSDAVMLSGETTIGDNPVASVRVMNDVAKEIEHRFADENLEGEFTISESAGVVDSVTSSAVRTARRINAVAIVALTASGFTARMLSRFKPDPDVLALSPNAKTCRQTALSYGCRPVQTENAESFRGLMESVRSICKQESVAQAGDSVVIAAGLPFSGDRVSNVETNMIFVEEI